MSVSPAVSENKNTLQQAFDLHQSGELDEACKLYSDFLQQQPEHVDALHLMGVASYQNDDLAGAEQYFRRTLELQPEMSEAHCNLGNVLNSQGQTRQAISAYLKAIELNPGFFQAWTNLGNAYRTLLQYPYAENAYRKALENNPNFFDAYVNLGGLLKDMGRREESLKVYQQALELNSENPSLYYNIGQLQLVFGHFIEAMAGFYHALTLFPDYAEAHFGMGNTFFLQGRHLDAIRAYQKAVALNPEYVDAYGNLGNALAESGKYQEAENSYRAALAMNPDFQMAHNGLGETLAHMGREDAAIVEFRRAIEINPEAADAYNNLGKALVQQAKPAEALEPLEAALAISPQMSSALYNYGYALNQLGRRQEAYTALREVVRQEPRWHHAHSTLLMNLSYDADLSPQALLEEHKAWGQQHGTPLKAWIQPFKNTRDPQRRLKIGYVSSDLGTHPVGFMTYDALKQHDHSQYEIYIYSGRTKADELAKLFEQNADVCRSTVGLSDTALAEQIRDDGIDILIDLSGHTAGGRLPTFAEKPAPVQMTWIGYCDTSGLDTIDYILMDPYTVPETSDDLFVEKVLRLPDTRFCYSPPGFAPRVNLLPALSRGYITFGSFNNLLKVTADVVALWCRVLEAVPQARLVINWPTLKEAERREELQRYFTENGMDLARIELRQGNPTHQDVLAAYGDIDIGLDTFPYSGGITTSEAMWMGVPVVTLPGVRAVSRQSASIIHASGFPELIARDQEDYVRIATELAEDFAALALRRREQRDKIASSVQCDSERFSRHLEAAYRQAWQDWCSSEG
ncbi:MAG TPA: tetratricopeptide repeat protein [Gammaproteobacteria bacterium]|nr:tetratricopeptide repeat protein [Gammaproteobacteria bacterium]